MLVNQQDIDNVAKMYACLRTKAYRGGRMGYHFEKPVHRYINMVIGRMVSIQHILKGDENPNERVSMFGSFALIFCSSRYSLAVASVVL